VPKDRKELATQENKDDDKNRKRKRMKRMDGRIQGRGPERRKIWKTDDVNEKRNVRRRGLQNRKNK
jgi:hypothetical protein